MSSNTGFHSDRSSCASREKQMAAYAALPRSIRAAVAGAVFNWAPYTIKLQFEHGNVSAKEWVCRIHQADRQQIERDRVRVGGFDREPELQPIRPLGRVRHPASDRFGWLAGPARNHRPAQRSEKVRTTT